MMSEFVCQRYCTVIELGKSYDSLDLDALNEIGSVLLTHARDAEPPRLVLDMSQTGFIGSTFIELLVRTWKRLRERGGTLSLCELQPFCQEVLRVTHLETIWPCYPTRDEAIRMMEKPQEAIPSI